MTINWNHHPDGSCGIVRISDCEKQIEGYYTSHEGKWSVSIYDNFTDNRGWSRIEYVVDLESREQAIEKLTVSLNIKE